MPSSKRKALFTGSKIVVYTDGGSRGNPGPAAIGVAIGNRKYGEYIGVATNNQAEYGAVVFALKKVKQLIGRQEAARAHVEVRMDSQLAVKQLNREFKVRDEDLKPVFVDVLNLALDFGEVRFVHIPREKNKIADRLVNEVLDAAP